jgi:hypothetical protein
MATTFNFAKLDNSTIIVPEIQKQKRLALAKVKEIFINSLKFS